MQNTPAILFLLFNRPDLAIRVFKRIRDARPSKLFVAVDGPRSDVADEDKLCGQCRSVADLVDWPCEVYTLFRDYNLGCEKGVSSAIDWFFTHVDEGIILEDDCLPIADFFRFCSDCLDHYREDERIMTVCGFQPLTLHAESKSILCCSYNLVWGWATWKRAWIHYKDAEVYFDEVKKNGGFVSLFYSHTVAKYWELQMEMAFTNKICTWDYRWMLVCWARSGMTVLPRVNLIANIGFDERATHTSENCDAFRFPEPVEGKYFSHFPIVTAPDRTIDKLLEKKRFGIMENHGIGKRVGQKVDSALARIKALKLIPSSLATSPSADV